MLELLFSKTPKEEKKRQLEENADTIKPIYEVVKRCTFDCTPEEIYKKLYGSHMIERKNK